MSETIQAALIGLIGALLGALLTGFMQPLLTTLLGKRSRLHVVIRAHSFSLPKFLEASISDYLYGRFGGVYPSQEVREKLLEIASSSGFTSLSIKNKSRRRIDGVTLNVDAQSGLLERLDQKPACKGQLGPKIPIGALQPSETAHFRIWTSTDLSTFSHDRILKRITVTADEFDKIQVVIENPYHIDERYFLIRRWIFWAAFWLVLILTLIPTIKS